MTIVSLEILGQVGDDNISPADPRLSYRVSRWTRMSPRGSTRAKTPKFDRKLGSQVVYIPYANCRTSCPNFQGLSYF
jgi:hypothetical protein